MVPLPLPNRSHSSLNNQLLLREMFENKAHIQVYRICFAITVILNIPDNTEKVKNTKNLENIKNIDKAKKMCILVCERFGDLSPA